jgi:membrane associated rhomboid family serine protease
LIPLRDTIPSRTAPVITVSLIIVNVIAFLHELSLGDALAAHLNTFAVVPAKSFSLLAQGHYLPGGLPFLTAMFLHGDWWHLIGNMLYLWIFGDNVEDLMGHARYLLFYLLCGMGSALAHAVSAAQSTLPSLGASGAIAGVLGAYILLFPRSRVVTLLPIFFFIQFVEIPAVFFLGIWFLIQLTSGISSLGGVHTVSGGVAWWAHIGGFVLGMVLVPIFTAGQKRRRAVFL